MSTSKGIWFVYRSHYAGPLSKRVCRLDAPSILAWFQDKIADARGAATPREVADAELGGSVYGFGTLLEAAKKHQLPAPKSTSARPRCSRSTSTWREARRTSASTITRCASSPTTTRWSFAYFFFDDEATREHATRLAYLLHEDAELPEGDSDEGFEPPMPIPAVASTPATGGGEGATYACLLTFHDGQSLPGTAAVFPGVRLPGLAAHLRAVTPAATSDRPGEQRSAWPIELRVLRAMLDEGDTTLGPALLRCAAYPLGYVAAKVDHARLGVGPHAAARGEFTAAAVGHAHGGDPSKSFVRESEHVALLCDHASTFFGYQQWVFFDNRWAAEQPDLAESLLRYATAWDPFPFTRRSAAESAADQLAGDWDEAVAGRAATDARRYRPANRFAGGDLIEHAKFGLGVVRRAESTTIEVIFRDATRKLAHGAGG